jgi:hypothetical protein
VPAGAFTSFDEMAVAPTSIHARKGPHEEAITRLLEAFDAALGAESAATSPSR